MSVPRIPRAGSIARGPALQGGRRPETTGRQIVVFADAGEDPGVAWGRAGLSVVADSRDFAAEGVSSDSLVASDVTFFAQLGIAVVAADPAQVSTLETVQASGRPILSVSPELVHHALQDGLQYARAYRDGVDDLAARVLRGGAHAPGEATAASVPGFHDTPLATWGIQAVRADSSPRSGRGIGVAVLDTGLDMAHPDFVGRNVTATSFVSGEDAQDGHGHGTHCVGTSCGPRTPSTGPRYGIAHEADIFAGKVLSNAGSGSDGGILAGIDWAVTNGCAVIAMALGADVPQAHPPYSAAGRRALQKGSLIIAAAGGNADRRTGNMGFVGAPANCPEVIAVGALDQMLEMAPFSPRSQPTRGGQADLVGPGHQVTSAWPMPTRYRALGGTSMAAQHVAGVAALWAEATERRGLELWATLCRESRRLVQPSVDVGSGIVLAPR